MDFTTATASLVVGKTHTALAVGSGEVPALATPWLIAVCEQATLAAAAAVLDPAETSVGVHVDFEHLAPSGLGATVTSSARIETLDTKTITCTVTATDGGRLVGRGTIVRARVNRERFMQRMETP